MKTWLLIVAAVALSVLLAAIVGRRLALELIRERRLRVDRFKLRRKFGEIERDVFSSRPVVDAIVAHARSHGVPVDHAQALAESYLREIVPKFNLLAYYRFGAPVARALLYFLYRVVVQRRTVRSLDRHAKRDTVVIYLINHRSNADYLLVAHMLFKFISLSYAVGEWARVWPLNHLFKWFGAYFVRRNFREPLYHAVLGSYVATITRRGVTQGVFLEGGLSRDGLFRKPKLGMLDYIVSSKRDPEFTGPLVFIPTAINYDRVLEDRALTRELLGQQQRAGRLAQLRQTSEFLFKNMLRGLFGRFKRYGFAVVSFGEPIVVDEFLREHPDLLDESWEKRKPPLEELARRVMDEISRSLPITPVCAVASIFREAGPTPLAEAALVERLGAIQSEWSDRGWYLRETGPTRAWETARRVLELRGLIRRSEAGWRWDEHELALRDYYANALVTFEEAMRMKGGGEATDS